MTQQEHSARRNRAQTLVDLVEKVQGGYRVRSAQNSNITYFVSKPNGQKIVCNCPDFEVYSHKDPSWLCKHILAAIEAHRQGKLESPAAEDASRSSGSTPKQSPEDAPPTQGEALSRCARCEAPFSADELLIFPGPEGTELLCRGCYDLAVRGEERPCSPPGSQTGALDSVPEKPPLLYACASCGLDGLSYKDVVPYAMNLGEDEGTICLPCLDAIRNSKSIERPGQSDGKRRKRRKSSKGPESEAPDLPEGRERNAFPLSPLASCPSPDSSPTLAQKVVQANDILASWGAVAIETDQKGYTGYGFQYVIDAVNSALDPDGWRYELLSHQVEKSSEKAYKAVIQLRLELRQNNGSWFTKGPQFGGSQNIDPTDALKGALSDGLKKAFSHWGVANLAYRGELKAAK